MKKRAAYVICLYSLAVVSPLLLIFLKLIENLQRIFYHKTVQHIEALLLFF